MYTIADYISQKDQIADLQSRLKKTHKKYENIRVSRNKISNEKVKLTRLLVGLQLDGRLSIKDIDLAELIFVDVKTIIRTRHAVNSNEKRTNIINN